jgi:hypothetical protein
MLLETTNLQRIARILAAADPARLTRPQHLEAPVFVGSGDSLAACVHARHYGHCALSAGDLAWTSVFTQPCKTVVGVSYSGRTGATVGAVRAARSAGLATAAVTSDAESPMALEADAVIEVPTAVGHAIVPAAGFVCLAAGVLAACGLPTNGLPQAVAAALEPWNLRMADLAESLPARPPAAISILSLPDLRPAGDFWSLKFIEATGIAARSVPLEECGHVDYFIGPQAHLVIDLIGRDGGQRHARLTDALRANGHETMRVEVREGAGGALSLGAHIAALAIAVAGAELAYQAARSWNRQPFRGGAVDLTGGHITLDERRQQ